MYFSHDKPRPHQEALIKDVADAIEGKRHLLAHAPTGIGKTAAVLSPAITYALENKKTVFFLTPKISQHKIAVDEISALAKRNSLDFKAVDIVGRKHSCVDPLLDASDHHSFYEICRRRRKQESCLYHNNARAKKGPSLALQKLLEGYGTVKTNSELAEMCSGFKFAGKSQPLCAYEISLQLAQQSSVIVGDYFHVLYPLISKNFLKSVEKNLGDSIVIIDEAQNAGERVRSILSHSLSMFNLKRAIAEAQSMQSPLERALFALKQDVEELAKRGPRIAKLDDLRTWEQDELEELQAVGNGYLESADKTKSACLSIHGFLQSWPEESEEYLRISNSRGVHHNCLDASAATAGIIDQSHSVIAMSGTLTPLGMYRDLLGFEMGRTELREYSSPFPPENRINIVSDAVTTRYAKRSDEQFERISNEITKIADSVPGNIAVFFPSYNVMRESMLNFRPNKPVYSQKEGSTPRENALILEEFRRNRHFGAVLCAVAGGSFAEGLDYPGRDLVAAIVVGVPLAEWNLETQALVDYYEYKFGEGWNYGYLFPAMNRAIQAAGRVIRNETDRGAIVFMDERFRQVNYAKCFPEDMEILLTRDPAYCVGEFFRTNK